ncbi:MAG: hypothetical protein GXO00_01950 [Candidatus Diapherotrites archaeon]|nr:hypothetical protein [Candidatus Diapherotrites archaeon]
MADDFKKIIKKQRKRFSQRRREIREQVHEDFLSLVEERIRSFKEYISRWCDGRDQEGAQA